MRQTQSVGQIAVLMFALLFLGAAPAGAYSVIAHLGAVDASWDHHIAGLLQQRFGRLSPEQLKEARAYAYGGALIQDLGYYPFGSHLFTDLTHYVRSGDFVESLIRNARDPDEYAFALGALAHYAFDNTGHPVAVNRAVPIMYPKVKAKVGSRALYVDSPSRHLMVEFAFDVLQVAGGGFAAQDYHDRIGFHVSKRLLEQAVQETYGLALGDMLMNVDLAIGTYRHAVSKTIPDMTMLAWQDKHDDIVKRTPDVTREKFIYALAPQDYDREFGTTYRKPSFVSRLLAFVVKILPKIGPMRTLAFEPLNADAERLFVESGRLADARYVALLRAQRSGQTTLANTDFDTGHPPVLGQNALTDKTYADLLHKLTREKDAAPSLALCRDITGFFGPTTGRAGQLSGRRASQVRTELALLNERTGAGAQARTAQ
jgi:zinc dependent phospholipase C